MTEPVITHNGEGRFIMEGEECTQVYCHTDKLIFATSTLLPGQKACLDKGHKDAHEICYVIEGTIIMHLPKKEKYYQLEKGSSILIPPGEPHYSINIGETKSVTAWACAPHL
ncbi:MAG: cupin domain-containing protein [Spirochaetes bacterium]|nr:cupin domain-containing protein [Spirochaetota bacterium]